MHPGQWLDLKTVSEATGIPASTLRWWAASERWTYVIHNGRRHYRTKDISDRQQQTRREHLRRKLAA